MEKNHQKFTVNTLIITLHSDKFWIPEEKACNVNTYEHVISLIMKLVNK